MVMEDLVYLFGWEEGQLFILEDPSDLDTGSGYLGLNP